MNSKLFSTKRIVLIGLFAAMVFVSNYIQTPKIYFGVGDPTRLHAANAVCLLSGLLLGAVPGGLAAGIGSFFYDLFDPVYASEAYITFIFKFSLAFVCGFIAHSGKKEGKNVRYNIIGGILGSVTYLALYLGKTFVKNYYFLSNPLNSVLTSVGQKFITSSINAIFAVCVSVPLCVAIRVALDKNKMSLK